MNLINEKFCLLHNVGRSPVPTSPAISANYNTLDQITRFDGVLTFDGVYKNVYHNKAAFKDHHAILFVMGNYVGGDNSFDKGMPLEEYCDWNEIMEMVTEFGWDLGWHTWSHPDLTKCDTDQIIREITPPIPMKYFAYPYGKFNVEVEILVERRFEASFGVNEGNGSIHQIKRPYLPKT